MIQKYLRRLREEILGQLISQAPLEVGHIEGDCGHVRVTKGDHLWMVNGGGWRVEGGGWIGLDWMIRLD